MHQRAPTDVSDGLPKCKTGIAGLDAITHGGLPRGRPTLVCGGAGCGKTLFAMEFLARGAVEFGEPGVVLSFEETADELTSNVRSLGFNLDELVAQNRLYIDHVRVEPSEIDETGDYDLDGLFVRLNYGIQAVGPKRVVLDTLEALFAGLSDQALLRSELRRLFRWLKDQGVTAVITGERGEGQLTRHGLEEYISDCVILLDNRVTEQLSTRRLRIVKYRGSRHGANEYPFLIDSRGFNILPITSVVLDHPALEERVPTGIERLDTMLGGGYTAARPCLPRGRLAPARPASRPVSPTRAAAAASAASASPSRKRKVRWCAICARSASISRNGRSRDCCASMRSGPTVYGLEMHLVSMFKEITDFAPATVIVDPIGALLHAGGRDDVALLVTRLVNMLKARNITALFTSLISGGRASEPSEIGISSLVDTWLLLRSVESNAERNRVLYVLKSRGMAHSNQVREFVLTERGVELVDVSVGPKGVLTGASRAAQQSRARAEERDRQHEIERRRRELERKQRLARAQIAVLTAELAESEGEIERYRSEQERRGRQSAEEREEIARLRWADEAAAEEPSQRAAEDAKKHGGSL